MEGNFNTILDSDRVDASNHHNNNTSIKSNGHANTNTFNNRQQYDISVIELGGGGKQRKKRRAPPSPAELNVTQLAALAAATSSGLYRSERMQEVSLEERSRSPLKTKSSQYSWLILTVGKFVDVGASL